MNKMTPDQSARMAQHFENMNAPPRAAYLASWRCLVLIVAVALAIIAAGLWMPA